ncbi:unnamed protein product [Urochloa decumbens]|uniref:KIB1-4 beta-propeller domain-containing protein n=1 Tax=Urochloa decumbens TaxID=240449 RepID=A0ABC9AX63_9POAL
MAEGMADWSSLPSDLINRVAARFLATNDLDHYMDLRAVCHSWRSSTADPRTTAANDPRFRPRCWVILDEIESASGLLRHHDDTRLFVNAATGRFLPRSLPLLRGYYHVTTTPGGFLVLADRKPPHAARLLNPFTGAMARFRASMPRETYLAAAAVVGSFTLVLACNAPGRLYWADPESEAFLFETRNILFPSGLLPLLASEYAGRKHGSAVTEDADEATNKMVDPVRSSAQLENRTAAVSSTAGGETETLLLVTLDLEESNHLIQVRKRPAAASSAQEGVLQFEQVTSIGNNALFVGDRCLLVDADKLPSVDANCVYYYQLKGPDEFIFRYDLDAGKAHRIAMTMEDEHPLTLIQLLVNYTMNGPSYELMWDEMLQRIPEDICLPDYDLDYDDIFLESGD